MQKTLTVKGQMAFWDKQASVYEEADMTVDNKGEMEITLNLCNQIPCKEIITFGGAVGCRDPKMILEKIILHKKVLPKVVFNDLSSAQVEWAKGNVLRLFEDMGINITYLPGEIRKVCKQIDKKEDTYRLIIGVYNQKSFFNANPEEGYPLCGFDEYLKNSLILGEDFSFEWLGRDMKSCSGISKVNFYGEKETQLQVKNTLASFSENHPEILGLQIVGSTKGKKGFFISHWYESTGFKHLLEKVFPASLFSVKQFECAKGIVFSIDPVNSEPEGVITVLNNVIGNILPTQQLETLVAIRNLMV